MSEQIHLTVTGMTCGGCERAVARALQRLDGVTAVQASHEAERVDVTRKGDVPDRATIVAAIEALGYAVPAHTNAD
ncbi:MAG: heavy-metal-associated domain-containing protein [Vicinamibacterales bacterium]